PAQHALTGGERAGAVNLVALRRGVVSNPSANTVPRRECSVCSSDRPSCTPHLEPVMAGTSVLPDAPFIDFWLFMPDKQEKAYLAAHQRGGACTKKFNQGSDDKEKGLGFWYHKRKKSNGKTWGGVCKALSIYWIAYHANERDFWGWLQSDEGKASTETAT